MHGEARHLKAQAELARAMRRQGGRFRLIDGEIVRLAPDPGVIDDAPVGRLFRDGRLLVSEADGPVRERRKLAAVGIVMRQPGAVAARRAPGRSRRGPRRRAGSRPPTATR